MPRKISVAKFKDQCVSLLEKVGSDGIIITRNGKPIARLLPVTNGFSKFIGSMKGRLKIRGDISSTGLDWHAQP